MSILKTRKFLEVGELDIFLNGGVVGGADLVGGAGGNYGTYALVGKTLKFAQPSATTVTFVASTDPNNPDPNRLTFKDIKAQIEAAIAAVSVQQFNKRLVLIQVTPSAAGVTVDHTGTGTKQLGFDPNHDTVGIKYGPISTTAPCLQAYMYDSGTHMIITYE